MYHDSHAQSQKGKGLPYSLEEQFPGEGVCVLSELWAWDY